MFQYDNKFKTANRSFGEIITLKYSFKRIETNKYTIAYFAQFLGQGNFGIDKLQSFAHIIGNIQDDIEILEMVRMPRNIWYGVGTNFKFNRNLILRDSNYKYGFLSYVGTNRISINPYILSEYKYAKFSTFNKIGPVSWENFEGTITAEALVDERRDWYLSLTKKDNSPGFASFNPLTPVISIFSSPLNSMFKNSVISFNFTKNHSPMVYYSSY